MQKTIHRAVIYSGGSKISPDDLELPRGGAGQISLGPRSLEEVEKRHILQIMRETGGNKSAASKILGIKSLNTLRDKLKEYGYEK